MNKYKNICGWSIAIAVLLFFCFVPVGLPKLDARIFGVILFAVVMWIFAPIPQYASTLLSIPLLYMVGVPAKEALIGFNDSTWIFMLSVFIFGAAIQASGIGRRIALAFLSHVSASYSSFVLGFLLVGLVLTFIIPSSVAKSAVMLPIAVSIAREMGEDKNSPGMAGLTLSVMFGGWTTAGLVPTGAVANLIILGVILQSLPQYGYYTTYAGWMGLIGLLTVLITVVTWIIIVTIFKPKNGKVSKEVILNERKTLPPKLSGKEKRVLVLAVLAVLSWSLSSWTGIPVWVTGVFFAALMASPGIGSLEVSDFKKLDWSTVIWMGGILTIAYLMSKYAIAGWIAGIIIQLLHPFSGNIYVLGLVISIAFLLLSILVVNPYVLASVLLPPLASSSAALGVDPIVFVALFLMLFRFFIFPYQCQPAVAVYGMTEGEGYTLPQVTKVAIIQSLCALPITLIAIAYWSIIGIL